MAALESEKLFSRALMTELPPSSIDSTTNWLVNAMEQGTTN